MTRNTLKEGDGIPTDSLTNGLTVSSRFISVEFSSEIVYPFLEIILSL
jgi:hypothetical protein